MRVCATKTIIARIIRPRMGKWLALNAEYSNWLRYLRGEKSAPLYSATKQQAERLLKRLGESFDPSKQYPMILRRDTIKLQVRDTKLTKYWLRIPLAGKRGGIWVPIQPHAQFDPNWELRQAMIVLKNGSWFCHLNIRAQITLDPTPTKKLIAVDLGDRNLATTVEIDLDGFRISNPKFYGREIRGIRRHYDWLRRRLGERKLSRMIRRIGAKERRMVNHLLHCISKSIVDRAQELNALILIGKLKGIRNRRSRSKTLNRIVHRMPFTKLTRYIQYKSDWAGIPVIVMSESYTSRICYRCGAAGKRLSQARFNCHKCGLDQFNADLNGAINLAWKFLFELYLSYTGRYGAGLTQPLTPAEGCPLSCAPGSGHPDGELPRETL